MLPLLLCALLSLYMLLALDMLSFGLKRKGWARFASTFLLFYAQVIATEFLLGTFYGLYSYSLIALNLVLTTGLAVFLQRKFGKDIFDRYLTMWHKSIVTFKKDLRNDPLYVTLVALLVAFLCWIVFLGAIFPSIDYDGNSYHLTFVGDMIQNHTFYDTPTSEIWVKGYPKGGEFIQAWTALITHNDIVTDLTQVPFLLLALYALYQAGVELGADKKHARFAAALFAFLPIVMNQLKTAYVDVILCSVFLAGIAIVLQKKLRRLDLLLLGIVFSLIISIKSTGIFFVIALLPPLFWSLYGQYRKAARRYIKPIGLLAGPLVFGLYWYAKDLVLYGSPIYPYGVQLAGQTIFRGMNYASVSGSALQLTGLPHSYFGRIWFVWTEQQSWYGCMYNYDTNYAGLGPIWLIILVPAFLVSIYLAVKKHNIRYLIISAIVALLYVVYPQNFYTRYTMFITALGILGLGIVLSGISVATARAVKVLSIALALFIIFANFTLCNYPPGAVRRQLKSVVAGSQRGIEYTNFPGEAYVFLEGHIKAGQVVAYTSKPYFVYPLWTPNFSDKVIYIPAGTNSSWVRQVKKDHVKYIFATLSSRQHKWATTDRMKEVYKDNMYEIFQVY